MTDCIDLGGVQICTCMQRCPSAIAHLAYKAYLRRINYEIEVYKWLVLGRWSVQPHLGGAANWSSMGSRLYRIRRTVNHKPTICGSDGKEFEPGLMNFAFVFDADVAPILSSVSSVPSGPKQFGARCTRCNLVNEYAETSSSYICYECR